MTAASDTLVSLLADPDSGVKLRAAAKIIEIGLQAVGVTDLKQQLQELEEKLEEAEKPQKAINPTQFDPPETPT